MALHARGDSGSRLAARGLHGWLLKRWQLCGRRGAGHCCATLLSRQAGSLTGTSMGMSRGPNAYTMEPTRCQRSLAGRVCQASSDTICVLPCCKAGKGGTGGGRGEEELGQGDEAWVKGVVGWPGRGAQTLCNALLKQRPAALYKCTYEEQAEQRQLAVKAAGLVRRLAGCRLRGRGRR